MDQRRLDYIDSLRALAAIGIIIFHLRVIAIGGVLPTPDWSQGFIYWVLGSGVTLFFVLSAYLLSMLAPSYERSSNPILTFYIKRLFRIAPLFFFVIIIWADGHIPLSTKFLLNMTFLFNLFPSSQDSLIFAGWTIGVEMLFYLIFPFLFRALPSLLSKLGALLASILLFIIVQRHIQSTTLIDPVLKERYQLLTIFRHLPTFLIGMIAFDVFQRLKNLQYSGLIALLFVGGTISIFYAIVTGNTFLVETQYWQSIACAMLLVAFGLCPMPGVNAATAFIGKISYSIYLLHGFVIVKMGIIFSHIYDLGLPNLVCFGLAILLALAVIVPVSAITYYLIEWPGNFIGRKVVAMVERRSAERLRQETASASRIA
jgi:peptidoglycan/LPS O-acetylase OafA/YrhL